MSPITGYEGSVYEHDRCSFLTENGRINITPQAVAEIVVVHRDGDTTVSRITFMPPVLSDQMESTSVPDQPARPLTWEISPTAIASIIHGGTDEGDLEISNASAGLHNTITSVFERGGAIPVDSGCGAGEGERQTDAMIFDLLGTFGAFTSFSYNTADSALKVVNYVVRKAAGVFLANCEPIVPCGPINDEVEEKLKRFLLGVDALPKTRAAVLLKVTEIARSVSRSSPGIDPTLIAARAFVLYQEEIARLGGSYDRIADAALRAEYNLYRMDGGVYSFKMWIFRTRMLGWVKAGAYVGVAAVAIKFGLPLSQVMRIKEAGTLLFLALSSAAFTANGLIRDSAVCQSLGKGATQCFSRVHPA